MATIQEMVDRRAKLVAEARAVNDEAGDKAMSPEQREKFDKIMGEADGLTQRINDAEVLEKEEARQKEYSQSRGRRSDPENPGGENRNQAASVEYRFEKRRIPFHLKVTDGENASTEERALVRRGGDEYRAEFVQYLAGRGERRHLQLDLDDKGGYLAPAQIQRALIQRLDDMLWIRQRATVLTGVPASGVGVPSIEVDPSDADWTAEIGPVQRDTDMRFGRRELVPRLLAKRIRVSQKMLRSVALAESAVIDRLAYKHGVAQERAFMVGTGADQPLGLFTPHNSGIPTSRDTSAGNTTTAVTFDGLTNAVYALKMQYRRNAAWIGHRDFFKMVRKLKDGEGRYLWQPSTQAGSPDLLLGYPALESEYVPNTFTTGQYVALFGDLSQYIVAESLGVSIQRLDELYAETSEVGFIGRMEVDGMPASVGGEAFARVQLA